MKDPWQVSGCDFKCNSARYKVISQRVRHVIKAKERAEETKINEAKMQREKRREQKVLQHKHLTVQQHRHEANRYLDTLAVAQGEKRQMQKRIDELEAAVETASSRWVSLLVCCVKCIYLIYS